MAKMHTRMESKRDNILNAAKTILTKRGKEVSMSDIAEALGIDASGIYYYFKSVPEIIDSILGNEYHNFSIDDKRFKKAGDDPVTAVKEMMMMLCEFYYDNLEILKIVLAQVNPLIVEPDHEDRSIAVNRFLASYYEANRNIIKAIRKAQLQGELSKTYSAELILQTMRGYVFGLWSAWRDVKPERSEIPGYVERFLSIYHP